MLIKRCMFFSFLALLLFSNISLAKLNIDIVVGENFTKPSDDYSTKYTAKYGLSGGLDLSLRIKASRFSIGTGAYYITRKFFLPSSENTITTTVMKVPATLCIDLWKQFLSFYVGGYYAQGLGNVKVKNSATTYNLSYSAAQLTNNDMGAIAGIKLSKNIRKSFSLVLNLGGDVSIQNAATTGTFRYVEYFGLFGGRFEL